MSLVSLTAAYAVMPPLCSNCGAIPAATERESFKGNEVLVPYCDSCLALLFGQGTRQLAATLASVLIAVTLLLTLPNLSPNLSIGTYVAASALAASLPALLVWSMRPVARPPLTSDGRAAWWVASGQLCCTNSEFAAAAATLNGTVALHSSKRTPILRAIMLSGAVLAVLVGPGAYSFLHPQIRVLNLAAPEFELFTGDTALGRVPASSLESPGAGLTLRLGVGERLLRAVGLGGETLSETTVKLSAGASYLYAPLSEDYCFWLERDDYGRADRQALGRYRPLPRGRDFWLLPPGIDNWFAENPEPAKDRRSSGGTLTALRQARCTDAPAEVRR